MNPRKRHVVLSVPAVVDSYGVWLSPTPESVLSSTLVLQVADMRKT